jgi:DNA-binding NarL/FixJ family response regulator
VRTRIVLAALPKMLCEIVRETLASRSDLEIVAEVDTRTGVTDALTRTGATIAVIGVPAGTTRPGCAGLLRAHPGLRVVAITADGGTAWLCELRLEVSVVTEVSPKGLLAVLEAVARREDVDRDVDLFSAQRPIPNGHHPSDN